ncbi:MAG: DUF4437 domain-containing protein [Bacteroidota bacterium]
MKKLKTFITLLLTLLLFACSETNKAPIPEDTQSIPIPTNRIILSSDINWEQLNPARGDKSPQAGTVWGDRKDTVPTGFLAKFVDGFSSPPHIHNVTYRAVVIKGLVHNDDPEAANMWMPPGSFWTQPAGEPHITSAKGVENIAYVEIDRGPYLVMSVDEAFDNGERLVNVDRTNILWLGPEKTTWVAAGCKAEISFLWESKRGDGLSGLFVRLPVGFEGRLKSKGDIFHAIIVQGNITYQMPQESERVILDPASYFGSEGEAIHAIANNGEEESVIYIRTDGKMEISHE